MPRRTYGKNRRRPVEQNGAALTRLEQELHPPEWQQRRIDERANRRRNQPPPERKYPA